MSSQLIGSLSAKVCGRNVEYGAAAACALGVKLICLALGALGIANMWAAIFADVGVMIIAVLNAVRALFVDKL